MEQRNKAQRLGIGEGRDGEGQKFAQGKSGAKISHKGMCCANFAQGDVLCKNFAQGRVLCENFAQDTIHPPFAKLRLVQMVKFFGF